MVESEPMTPEQLEQIAEQIADLSLRIDRAKHALLTHLRRFDAQEGWANSGFTSAVAWLAWRIEIGVTAAREHVRVARKLGELPGVDAAFAAGDLSYAKVRAITRAATPEIEQQFIELAMRTTASQLEKVAAAYRRVRVDPSTAWTMDTRRFVRRSDTQSGMVRIEIQLPPEEANMVWEAMSSALDASRDVAREAARACAESLEYGSAPGSRDASAESSRSTLATGSSNASAESSGVPSLAADPLSQRADAIVSVAQAYLQHRPPTLGSSYELVFMTTQEQLEHGPGGIGGFLRDGTPLPLHIARMLACDCSRVDVVTNEAGEVLDIGRARRTIPSAIGRALRLRDGGCRVPGCGRTRHLHAHHIQGWAEGGKTSVSNLVLLCPSHHALVHEGRLSVRVDDGELEFHNAYGLRLSPVPARGEGLGVHGAIDAWLTAPELGLRRFPNWDGSPLDLGETVDGLLRTG